MFYFQELFFLYAVFWCCFREEKKFNRHKSLQSLVKNVLPNPDFCNPSPSLQSRFLTPCTTTFLNNAYLPCSRKYTRNSETCHVDSLPKNQPNMKNRRRFILALVLSIFGSWCLLPLRNEGPKIILVGKQRGGDSGSSAICAK